MLIALSWLVHADTDVAGCDGYYGYLPHSAIPADGRDDVPLDAQPVLHLSCFPVDPIALELRDASTGAVLGTATATTPWTRLVPSSVLPPSTEIDLVRVDGEDRLARYVTGDQPAAVLSGQIAVSIVSARYSTERETMTVDLDVTLAEDPDRASLLVVRFADRDFFFDAQTAPVADLTVFAWGDREPCVDVEQIATNGTSQRISACAELVVEDGDTDVSDSDADADEGGRGCGGRTAMMVGLGGLLVARSRANAC